MTPSSPWPPAPPTARRRWPKSSAGCLRHHRRHHDHHPRLYRHPVAGGRAARKKSARLRRRRKTLSRTPPARQKPLAPVIPALSGKLKGHAQRAYRPKPAPSDGAGIGAGEKVTAEEVNQAMRQAAEGRILGYTEGDRLFRYHRQPFRFDLRCYPAGDCEAGGVQLVKNRRPGTITNTACHPTDPRAGEFAQERRTACAVRRFCECPGLQIDHLARRYSFRPWRPSAPPIPTCASRRGTLHRLKVLTVDIGFAKLQSLIAFIATFRSGID